MDHDDAMRSLRLMGEEVIPAVREIGEELGLKGPFEVDDVPGVNKPKEEPAKAAAEPAQIAAK